MNIQDKLELISLRLKSLRAISDLISCLNDPSFRKGTLPYLGETLVLIIDETENLLRDAFEILISNKEGLSD